ncbi:hypothetical protein DL93DRAFT_2087466 [Clavulina sp. PMI_390]|nr:hypothetical protein DL93DRAFT_2087466 [Clavulina sp. PMI_390]
MEHDLALVKRVVTGHNEHGQSTALIVEDTPMGAFVPGSDDPTKLARIWLTKETPTNNDDQKTDFKEILPERFGYIQPNGSQASIVDIPPGGKSPSHRTSSIDYIILISGSLTLLLDTGADPSYPNGGTTIDVPGSIIVQRGTRHAWENRSTTEWTRFVGVMIDAKPVEIYIEKDGKKGTEMLQEGFNV